jgi:hypothetical protein
MKRLLISTTLLLSSLGVAAVGASGAFFSDAETSSGNTFSAGAIDLKVDNSSYYNGTLSGGTSWSLDDLTNTIHKFFDFNDVKPNDYGEDTISLHVNTNDAYLCANVTLTSNNDNTQTEPEAAVDANGLATGELANAINFIWWADDGDNVLEAGERVLPGGPLGALAVGQSATVALADSSTNIWTGAPGPLPGNTTMYVGKAWCFGTIGTAPLAQDGSGSLRNPSLDNDANGTAGQPADGGYTCNGSGLGNETQTDSVTADVTFTATQSRNNPSFLCNSSSCDFSSTSNAFPNAGFEDPVVANPALWDVFSSPTGGWNVEWRGDIPLTFGPQTRPAIAKLEFHRGVLGPAQEGQQYVELDTDWGGPSDSAGQGEPASVSIYKDIPTVPGATYNLIFGFAPRPNTPAADNVLGISVGGVAAPNIGPTAGGAGNPVWTDHNVVFVATSTVTRIRFTDLGTPNSVGTFLDNIRLNQVSCGQPPLVRLDQVIGN